MLRAIARALAAAASGIWRGALGALNFAEQIIRWPFGLIFGSGGSGRPTPHFEPATSGLELLDEFNASRARQAAARGLDRDSVDLVVRYAKATKQARATFDLSGLKADVQATLSTMDDNELKALTSARQSQIRKFAHGMEHGIHGVPAAKPQQRSELSADERVLWSVRARMQKAAIGQQFKIA